MQACIAAWVEGFTSSVCHSQLQTSNHLQGPTLTKLCRLVGRLAHLCSCSSLQIFLPYKQQQHTAVGQDLFIQSKMTLAACKF